MSRIKSFAFAVFINSWGAIIPVLYFPAFIFRSAKIADHGALVWSKVSLWCLKKICGIEFEIRGLEKLPKEGCIIACKHQSMWETIIMHLIFHRPVYAFKKELLAIPFYGWFLRVMSGITIDRKGGAKALKNLIKESKNYLNKGQSIILFPQGTRVPPEASAKEYPYQPGIAALYISCGAKIVPAALNSGVFWPKKGVKKSGKIIIEFLDPIASGLSRDEFMKKLEKAIEEGSANLL